MTHENFGPAPESTDLERRVLAHERILQALIVHMAESAPRFIDRLRAKFVEPMQTVGREHDAKDADAHAEDFIKAIMRTIDASGVGVVTSAAFIKTPTPSPSIGNAPLDFRSTERVQIHVRNGVWEVRRDGEFWGHYMSRDKAIAAAALAELSLSLSVNGDRPAKN